MDAAAAARNHTLVKYHNVDTSGVKGLWITCGASLSPWGTHLSSKEYGPNAFTAATDAQFKAFSQNLYGSETAANPYNYGHMPEVTGNPDGTRSIKTDTAGATIASEWMPIDLKALLSGEDIAADALGNTANPNRIGNPDNLKFPEKMRTLFIGEDSGQHVNNFLWAYNIDTRQLSRVMPIPAGGESTGLHAVDELNGWTYIMSNFQHAGDRGGIHNAVKGTLDPLVRANYKDKFGQGQVRGGGRVPDGGVEPDAVGEGVIQD